MTVPTPSEALASVGWFCRLFGPLSASPASGVVTPSPSRGVAAELSRSIPRPELPEIALRVMRTVPLLTLLPAAEVVTTTPGPTLPVITLRSTTLPLPGL